VITRSMLGPAISPYPAASRSPTELAVVGSRGLGVARRREVLKTRPGFPADSTSHVRAPASADSAMSSPPLLPQRPEVVRSTRRGPRVLHSRDRGDEAAVASTSSEAGAKRHSVLGARLFCLTPRFSSRSAQRDPVEWPFYPSGSVARNAASEPENPARDSVEDVACLTSSASAGSSLMAEAAIALRSTIPHQPTRSEGAKAPLLMLP
jgi:hypothetical protein